MHAARAARDPRRRHRPGRYRLLGLCVGFGGTFLVLTFLLAGALAALHITSSSLRPIAALVLLAAGATLALPAIARRVERAVPRRAAAPRALAEAGGTGDGGFGAAWPSGARWGSSGRPASDP